MGERRKANHKHDYILHLRKNQGSRFYSLLHVCSICGKVKDPPFKMHICKRSDGSRKWMVTLEDFTEVYGELPFYQERER